MTSQSKNYHAFISHSSQDKDAAKRLALDLQGRGYSVWFDEWEILVGHNIVDEVFGAIKQSHFMVVILSDASVKSRWVDEELTAAKTREIEDEQVVILPARLENCEIPTALTPKRYADFTGSWDDGVEEIARAIDGHSGIRPSRPANRIAAPKNTVPSFNELDQWREKLLPEMLVVGFVEGQPFKDVLIGPTDTNGTNFDRTILKPILDASRVRLRNWSGLSFPLDVQLPDQEIRMQTGLRYVNGNLNIFGTDLFAFWQIDQGIKFLQRAPVMEDSSRETKGSSHWSSTLAQVWDLGQTSFARLIFAKKSSLRNPRIGELSLLRVKFIWSGLSDRVVIYITLPRKSVSPEESISSTNVKFRTGLHEAEVTSESNRRADEAKLAVDRTLSGYFGWDSRAENTGPSI